MRGVNHLSFGLGAAATSAHWIGGEALLTLGDGEVFVVAPDQPTRRIAAHDGVILSAAPHPDGKRLVTGGDDGRVCALAPDGALTCIAELGKWVDHLVASPVSNVIVAGAGKQAIVFRDDKEAHRYAYPSSIGGIALEAKGRRLAVSHYGGANLRYVLTADDKGVSLPWTGSHLALTISADGEYVVTAMQENALHGWRLPDKTDLRMDGYPAKTRSFSWDKRGRWLATSGADSAIVWPFVGKLGPQGKPPLQLGQSERLVTRVAFHPQAESLAIGYADGAAALVRLADQSTLALANPSGGEVTALAWRGDGRQLVIADDAGRATLVDFGSEPA
jgi:WD40 repeat protein